MKPFNDEMFEANLNMIIAAAAYIKNPATYGDYVKRIEEARALLVRNEPEKEAVMYGHSSGKTRQLPIYNPDKFMLVPFVWSDEQKIQVLNEYLFGKGESGAAIQTAITKVFANKEGV